MYKLAFIFLFLACAHAKIVKKGGVSYKNYPGYDPDVNEALPGSSVCLADASKDTIWVLDFNDDLDFKLLRSANKMDKRAFRELVEPLIKSLSFKEDANVYLSPDDHNKVSLKLYFKGPFASLIVRHKSRRFNFFLRPPSSLPRWFYEKHTKITRTGKAMYVDIPDSVRNEFYGKFFHMLKAFLSFAI